MAGHPEVLSLEPEIGSRFEDYHSCTFFEAFFIQVKFCSTPYQRTYPYSSMVLLFEFSAFGIIFHGVKSVSIGNLTHSP